MASRSGTVLGHLYQLLTTRGADDQTDGQLLERFVAQREQSAFTTLMQRHGPLVLRVCRRLLGNTADAEDAFQATFLVLVRKARALKQSGSLAGWLYAVAYRVARRARDQANRRRAYERQAASMQARYTLPESADPELRALLDEELSRLPEKYRSPVVLCYLEGKTYVEAARQLRWPLGTVRGRVARARTLLRKRLARRGLAVPFGVFATVWASDAVAAVVPAALARATLRATLLTAAGKGAAAGALAGHASTLAEAVLKEMFVTRVQTVLAMALAFVVVGTGAGILARQAIREDIPAKAEAGAEASRPPETSRPLIPHLVARLRQDGEVRCLAFAPDGKTLAAASAKGTVGLWDLTAAPPGNGPS